MIALNDDEVLTSKTPLAFASWFSRKLANGYLRGPSHTQHTTCVAFQSLFGLAGLRIPDDQSVVRRSRVDFGALRWCKLNRPAMHAAAAAGATTTTVDSDAYTIQSEEEVEEVHTTDEDEVDEARDGGEAAMATNGLMVMFSNQSAADASLADRLLGSQ